MARRPTIQELERRLANARAREAYERPVRAEDTAVRQRGDETALYYRSLLRKTSATEHLVYDVNVLTESLNAVGGAAAIGLTAVLGAGEVSFGSMRRRIKPTRAHWYKGATSPTHRVTAWGTGWNRYYEPGSHQSVPISKATGTFDARDVRTTFTNIFGPGGSQGDLLGTRNGRCYLELEQELESSSFES